MGTEEIYRFFADLNSSQIGFNIEEMETHNVSSSLNDSEKSASDIKLFMETIFRLQKADRGRMLIREFDDALTKIRNRESLRSFDFPYFNEQIRHLVCSTLVAMESFRLILQKPLAGKPKRVCCLTNLVPETIEHFASHFELSCLALCPLLRGFSQTMVSIRDVRGGGFREAGIGERRLESTLRFGELCQHDLFGGNSAELADQANLGQSPDNPFRRIDLPGFHSVPIVMLKFVVIVMIPFAEGKDCEEPRITSAAF